jgi:dTDP-4-dehydrorhamnose reductase
MNVLVTGSNGQLGSELKELSECLNNTIYNFYFTTSKILDITNFQQVRDFIAINNIEIIINCAAYTAVDKAESEVDIANKINHIAVENIAMIAKENNIKLVHISTDYVFDGKNFKPYLENDQTDPQGVYGVTKLAGEKVIQMIGPKNSIIIRTSWVYSYYGNNFVKTMLRLGKEKESLGVIFDQVGTPTYALDLARTIIQILPQLNNQRVEIYNYSNEGVTSWYDFASEIMGIVNLNCKVNAIETRDYPTPAKRPYYSVLNKNKIKRDFGIQVPHWKSSLKKCLQKLVA